MSRIRVDPSVLTVASNDIGSAAGQLDSASSEIRMAGDGAPDYEGQFGPRVRGIVAELGGQVGSLASQLDGLGSSLTAKAMAFQAADEASLDGLSLLNQLSLPQGEAAGVLPAYALLAGFPLADVVRHLRLGGLLNDDPEPWWKRLIQAVTNFVRSLFGLPPDQGATPTPTATPTATGTPVILASPTVIPSATATPMPSATATPISTPTAQAGDIRVTTTVVHLRPGAGTASGDLGMLDAGTRVSLISGDPTSAEGYQWYNVTVLAGSFLNQQGWVAGDYLQDPAALYPGVGTSVRLTELPFASDVDLSGYQGFGRTTFAENNTCVWYSRTSGLHNGLDFDIPYGTELRWHSDQDASVVSTDGQPYGAGPHSVVLSSGGFVFIYGHTSDTDSPLAVGDTVHDGDLIGYSGNPSGTSTGGNDHLHFETRPADNTSVAVNPMGFFPQDTQDTISAATAADYPVGESATSLGYYTMGLDPSCITPTPTPAP